jgi:hypothetical protein
MSGITSSKVSAPSAIIFVVVVAAIVALMLLTHGNAVALGIRWVVTGLWAVAAIILGIRDFLTDSGSDDRDVTAFDRWTFIHAGGGLVFGVWFLPLWVVLVITVGWEVFEWLVPGFGDKEIFLNRVVDVGSALVCWLLVVIIAMVSAGAAFPLITAP